MAKLRKLPRGHVPKGTDTLRQWAVSGGHPIRGAVRNGCTWTVREDYDLLLALHAGVTHYRLARRHHRTVNGVGMRAELLAQLVF